MKSNLIIAFFLLATFALGYLYWNERSDRISLEKSIKSAPKVSIPEDVQHIADVVDEKGVQTAIYEEANKISEGQWEAVNLENDSLKKKINYMTGQLGIARSQISTYQNINMALLASNLSAKATIDSLGKRIFNYHDDNLTLSFQTDSSYNTGLFDFRYNANLSIMQYWDKKWLLGAKRSRIAITSADPRITINGYKKYDVLQNEPHFGLRIQGSGMVNPESGNYGIGPAARIDFARFSFQYQHLYFPRTQSWHPLVNLNYDVIRF